MLPAPSTLSKGHFILDKISETKTSFAFPRAHPFGGNTLRALDPCARARIHVRDEHALYWPLREVFLFPPAFGVMTSAL